MGITTGDQMTEPDAPLSSLAHRIAEVLARPDVPALDEQALAGRVSELTPPELGHLHGVLLAASTRSADDARRWSALAFAVRGRLPDATYTVDDAVRALTAVAREGGGREPVPSRSLRVATEVVVACHDRSSERVHAAACEVLAALRDLAAAHVPDPVRPRSSDAVPWGQPLELATLAALPGAEAAWPDVHDRLRSTAGSRWEASYRTLLPRLTWQELLVLQRAPRLWDEPFDLADARDAIGPDDIPAYRAWVHDVLVEALEHARDVQEGRVPYRADGAFTSPEATIPLAAALQASIWDEPWLAPLIAELLPGVAIAPDPGSRSVPSQAMAMGLGRAVSMAPTPETVETLRSTIPLVRHRGVVKKLQQRLTVARKQLGSRPTIVLRAAAEGPMNARQRTTVLRALEAGYLEDVTWELDEWLGHVRRQPALAELVGRLVWRITAPDGQVTAAARFDADADADGDGGPPWRDAAGTAVELAPGSSIALWHPIEADADHLEAWRRHAWDVRLEQPFRQVFREHFRPSFDRPGVLSDFAGYVVDSRVLLGVARAERWSIERLDPWLVRRFANFWARIEFRHRVYPGATETNEVGVVVVSEDRDGNRAWHPDDRADHLQLSELLRSVDLLVSVSALGLAGGPADRSFDGVPGGRRTWMDGLALRRDVIARAVADLPETTVSRTHLHVGRHAIHLRTARITEDGEEVSLEVQERPTLAVPWLPYDEKLLARILAAAAQCAGARTDGDADG